MHPIPLGEVHYILVRASYEKRHLLLCNLLGDLREVLVLMDKETYLMRRSFS